MLGKNCFEINDYTFDKKWHNNLQTQLNLVTSLTVNHLKLSEQNYVNLFSHPFPNLKKIKFTDFNSTKSTTPQLPKLFKPSSRLDILSDWKNWTFRELIFSFGIFNFSNKLTQQSTLIQKNQCQRKDTNYLEKRAFALLEKIDFHGKLQVLELAGNSLIDDESIESILKMIKPFNGSKSVLKSLNVHYTSITTDNLIRILQNIQVPTLEHLDIGSNAFQHSTNYQIPFNNTLFEQISDYEFSSLKSLNLSYLDLDDQQLPYLKKMKLPALQTLEIGNNFITDNYFSQWITQENMFSLKKINISKNSITDKAIQLLVEQNFTNLSNLDFSRNRKLSNRHLIYLSALNSSRWTYLDLSENCVNEKSLRSFFENRSFENLLELKMQDLGNTKYFFEFVDWKSMKNLQILDLFETDVSKSLQFLVQSNLTFSNLQSLRLSGQWLQIEHINLLMKNITSYGPKLKYLEFKVSTKEEKGGYFNFTDMNFDTFPTKILVKSNGFMQIYKPEHGTKFEVIELYTAKYIRKSSHFDEEHGEYPTLGTSNLFDVKFFGGEREEIDEQAMVSVAEKTFQFLSQFVYFRNIQLFWYADAGIFSVFVKILMKQLDQQTFSLPQEKLQLIKQNHQLYLPYLRALIHFPVQVQTHDPQFVPTLNKVICPLLNSIRILFQSQSINQLDPIILNQILLNQSSINVLRFDKNPITCEMLSKMFENVTLSFLVRFYIYRGQFDAQCLEQVISRHRRIKQLGLRNSTLLFDGLFDEILLKYQLLLDQLSIGIIEFQDEQFAKLSKLNREFITNLQASLNGLTSQSLKQLSSNLTQPTPLFPKMRYLYMNDNLFDQTGPEYLFSTGMPFLEQIWFFPVTKYSVLNKFVHYPTKMKAFYMLSGNIHNFVPRYDKRALRRTENMLLDFTYLYVQEEDYKLLAQTDLSRLTHINLDLKDIYQCQYLQSVLKIVQNVTQMTVSVTYNKGKNLSLQDNCLEGFFPLNETYMNHLRKSQISIKTQKVYMPRFFAYAYSTNYVISRLNFSSHALTDADMLMVLQNVNLEEEVSLDFRKNFLTDAFVQELFKNPLNKTRMLLFHQNDIKLMNVPALKGKTFHQLEILHFSMNDITDQSIDLLLEANFPKLAEISFEGNMITLKGFIKLLSINAPLLRFIYFLNCPITEEDLVYIAKYAHPKIFPKLKQIVTNVRVQQINSRRIERILERQYNQTGLKIEIKFFKFRLVQQNKALLAI